MILKLFVLVVDNFQNLKNKFINLGLKEDKIVQIEGDDTLLHSYYKNASVFIYPTLYEGFGLPILESFLYECPVVAAKHPLYQK